MSSVRTVGYPGSASTPLLLSKSIGVRSNAAPTQMRPSHVCSQCFNYVLSTRGRLASLLAVCLTSSRLLWAGGGFAFLFALEHRQPAVRCRFGWRFQPSGTLA
eukprot:2381375-Amphidinium_carterae.1